MSLFPRLSGAGRALSLTVLLLALQPSASAQASLPAGFVLESVGSDWWVPVDLAFIDQTRMLVGVKFGGVWLLENGIKKNVELELHQETLNFGSRGLLGLAIDPQFAANGLLYLLITVDPDEDGIDNEREAFTRLLRYQTAFDPDGNLEIIPGSRTVLLGMDWPSGIPALSLSHAGGALRFLSDGSLLVAHGDGADAHEVDPGGLNPSGFGHGRTSEDQDIGAFRSVYLDSYAGKILRVDPASGLGLPDNPWFTGDPQDIRSRLWVMGLRNPFRFTVRLGPPDVLYISDVGWNTWEEIDVALGGENFGWPCWQGPVAQANYRAADSLGFCPGVDAAHTPPLLAWHHSNPGEIGFTGACATGLAFYEGDSYPPIYRGRLFFVDFAASWIRAAELDGNGAVQTILDFASAIGDPVDLVADPYSGDLFYTSLEGSTHKIYRLRYLGGNDPPVAVATATPAWGPVPLTVALSGSQSHDPENGLLTHHWELGDGNMSEESDLVHVYPDPAQNHLAVLTVTDDHGHSSTAQVLITPGNTPPSVTSFDAPADEGYYAVGEPVLVAATAADSEDDQAGTPLSALWRVNLIHDHHQHSEWEVIPALSGSFVPEEHGGGAHHFVITLEVTDSRGLTDSRTVSIYDADAVPEAHLVDVSDSTPRAGQTISVTGHVDFPGSYPGRPVPTLVFDWGDEAKDVFADAQDQVDETASHVYDAPGTYTLELRALQDSSVTVSSLGVIVLEPAPAVALFLPRYAEAWVEWVEQQGIASTIQGAFTPQGVEVKTFYYDDQEELVDWMEAYEQDGVRDVLVLLDFAPSLVYSGQDDGSLAEEWLEHGNGIVWTGQQAFNQYVLEDAQVSSAGAGDGGADEVLDSSTAGICGGEGQQVLTQVAAFDVPSLGAENAARALRYDQLGSAWRLRRLYAHDADQDSDALMIEHSSGGFYAQFYGLLENGLNRAQVLREFLENVLLEPGEDGQPARRRAGPPQPGPPR